MNENDMPIFDPHNPNYTINNYEQNYKYEGETQQIEKNVAEKKFYKNEFINSSLLNGIDISTDVVESQSIDINNNNNEKNSEINNNNNDSLINNFNTNSSNNFSLLKNNNNCNKTFNFSLTKNITRNKRKNKSKQILQKKSKNNLKSQKIKNFIEKKEENKFIKEEIVNENESEDEDDVVSEDEEKINLNNIFNKNNKDYLNNDIFNQNCITKKNNIFMENYIKSISGFEKLNINDNNNEIEMNIKIIQVFDFNIDNEICKFSYNDDKKIGIIFVKKPIDDKIKNFLIKYLNNQQIIKIKLEKYEINNNNKDKNMNFENFYILFIYLIFII